MGGCGRVPTKQSLECSPSVSLLLGGRLGNSYSSSSLHTSFDPNDPNERKRDIPRGNGSAEFVRPSPVEEALSHLLQLGPTSQSPTPAYPGHHPLTGFQKRLLGLLASWGAASDPRRADLVAIVGETTGEGAFVGIRKRMSRSDEGRLLLKEKPRVTDDDVKYAYTLPKDTFGGAYAEFMRKRGFVADERPAVRFIDDPELAWVAARSREVHDFWHVLFECDTNVLGEAALKAVEFVQTGLPMTGMAVLAAQWKLSQKNRKLLNTVYLPWAIKAGSQASDLMCIYYEEYFDQPLSEVRKKWRILPVPYDDLA